jgi:DNA-binding CsgD family transcriptional regulator
MDLTFGVTPLPAGSPTSAETTRRALSHLFTRSGAAEGRPDPDDLGPATGSNVGVLAPRLTENLLLRAADRLALLDTELARDMYLEALGAAISTGHGAGPDREASAVARAARNAPEAALSRPVDLLLDGLITRYTDGYEASVPGLRRALRAFTNAEDTAENQRWLWLAFRIAWDLWDQDSVHRLVSVQTANRKPTPGAAMKSEGRSVVAGPASFQDDAGQLPLELRLWEETVRDRRHSIHMAEYAQAVLCNALGRYEEAQAAAQRAYEQDDLGLQGWALAELVEAAARTFRHGAAANAFVRLSEMTRASSTDWALGVEARARALLSEGMAADALYRESIERLNRSDIHRARSHLLYGEWLRREKRRIDARGQLRRAHSIFDAIGARAFAERAQRELLATGETARKRTGATYSELTAQEKHIAHLAGSRLTNSEIAMQLFISPRTVEWHLRKVFTKLGVSSRRELRTSAHDRILATRDLATESA